MMRTIRRLLADRRANVAPMFAIAAIPMLGLIGAAVDYSRANSIKTSLQAAIDSTALAMSSQAPSLTAAQLQTAAQAYFNALFTRSDAKNTVLTVTYTSGSGSQIVIAGTTQMTTNFVGILGMPTMDIGASTTSVWGNTRLRVALVLDNTGSMAQSSKLTALKTATKNLLSQLQSAATNNGDVYVSIIPFVKDVNLGASNYNATWIDWTDWNANNGTCSKKLNGQTVSTQSGCAQTNNGTWTPANHNTWNGCVVDRGDSGGPNAGNYDTNVTAPTTGTTATLYAAEQYSSCPQAVMGLSYDWSSMTTLVNNMAAAGNTNQAIGLQIGWMSIAGGGPFSVPAYDANYTYTKVIILLTDGLNTQDRWYTSQSSIDARQQMTCNNAKAAGIVLYTIQVNTGGDPTSTLLQNCASDSSKFFLLTSSNQIITTFAQIGTTLSRLRIAK
jgi:Flp pilus assembly protein TadG